MARQATGALSASRLANVAAAAVIEAFGRYRESFTEISRRAQGRFELRDWKGEMGDAVERLDLYSAVIDDIEGAVRATLGRRSTDRLVWAGMKAVYSGLIAERDDWELAETFFNSVCRRIFATVGVDSNIEFVDSDFEVPGDDIADGRCRTYDEPADARTLLAAVILDDWFGVPYEDPKRDARLAGDRLAADLRTLGISEAIERAEFIAAPFFRRKGAYLLGRLFSERGAIPVALALLNTERGLVLDALLTDENDISILFSFTRSHFHVDVWPPHPLVRYLKLLMPRKSIAEIYIALGHHKHGKTELYRDFLHHVRDGEERFELAPGTPGMVMVVFTMPGYDVVFKVIRDHFPAIKPMTAAAVRQNYRLVFRHDRAGRLVEAQEFEHLQFDRSRFTTEVLAEFERNADQTVSVGEDTVVVHHAYIERRVTPLDVYLAQVSEQSALDAVVDFGQAVKDLAANGIFPGELLPKNFGVTRHRRVVCYDYDELSLLTDFSFREIPAARVDDDEYADEAWFGVGPRDVFPEELSRFLGLPPNLRQVLDEAHGDLYQVGFWQEVQARVNSGEVIDIFPYRASLRLQHDPSQPR
jgi:isocitrate dehydrogenase kinase/phosphatase